ncbi:7517_t:CDS:2 [Entrophospora sp. SA101]|nr:7517_t:CDS:2 [Entrophospora sp. SA101]
MENLKNIWNVYNREIQQLSLSKFYECTTLITKRNDNINRALIKAFIMCDILFNVIQNPYLSSWLDNYTPPNRKAIPGRLLDTEVNNINTKINLQLENQKNLTLG